MSAESLSLSCNNTATNFPQLIQSLKARPNLEELHLSCTKLDANQARALAHELEKLKTLKVLDLTNAHLNIKGGPIIANAIPTSVEILRLDGSFSEDLGIQSLAKKLKICEHLKEVSLLDNPITTAKVELLLQQVLYIDTLKKMHISYAGGAPKEFPESLVSQKMAKLDFLMQVYKPETLGSTASSCSNSETTHQVDYSDGEVSPATPLVAETPPTLDFCTPNA